MKNDIKTVYLDANGNQHESRGGAAKANRLIESANLSNLEGASQFASGLLADRDDSYFDSYDEVIEFARAVVAIVGMKDGAK